MAKVPRASKCVSTSEMFYTQLSYTKSSTKLGIVHGELVFNVKTYSSFYERCHLDTNYVVIAIITLEEGVDLPFVCPKKQCQPGQVGPTLCYFI